VRPIQFLQQLLILFLKHFSFIISERELISFAQFIIGRSRTLPSIHQILLLTAKHGFIKPSF